MLKTLLKDHQVRAVSWMRGIESEDSGGILADEMGLGKTLTCIALVIGDHEPGNTLIITGTSILPQWRSEFEKHCTLNPARILVYHDQKSREELWMFARRPGTGVCLTTHGIMRNQHSLAMSKRKLQTTNLFCGIRWRRVIIDEAHVIRENRCAAFRAACALPSTGRRWAVTGTPISNWSEDIASLIRFVGAEPKTKALEIEWLTTHMLRRTKETAVLLPRKTFLVLALSMPTEERAAYDRIVHTANADREWGSGRYQALTWLLKTRQACVHHTLTGDHKGDDDQGRKDTARGDGQAEVPDRVALLTSTKCDTVYRYCQYWLDRDPTDKFVIFSQWTTTLAILRKFLHTIESVVHEGPMSLTQRTAAIARFVDPGGPPVLLCSIGTGAVGLNLVCANHVIFVDECYNPAIEDQAIDRVHRIGQSRPVCVVWLYMRDTVEKSVLDILRNKRSSARESYAAAGHPTPVHDRRLVQEVDDPKTFFASDTLAQVVTRDRRSRCIAQEDEGTVIDKCDGSDDDENEFRFFNHVIVSRPELGTVDPETGPGIARRYTYTAPAKRRALPADIIVIPD